MLKLGELAPSFNLPAYHNGEFIEINSEQYRKNWLILFFYPRDFTFVCPTELTGFAKQAQEFDKLNVKIVAASTDSVFSHKAWFEQDLKEVNYPIIADTTHNLSREYDVLDEKDGSAQRGTFIIDPDGVLRYILVSDSNVGRSVDETLRVVKALQTGGLCPIDWHPGEANL